jgi:hypothetical protein
MPLAHQRRLGLRPRSAVREPPKRQHDLRDE